MAIRLNYEVSSEGAVRHWPVNNSALDDTTPEITYPICLTAGSTAGSTAGEASLQLCGTTLTTGSGLQTVGASSQKSIVDFTPGMVYLHNVRNVSSHTGASTFRAINEGDPIYWDVDSSLPTGVMLSLAKISKTGNWNPQFGWAVLENEDDTLPVGASVASTQEIAVMQLGVASGGHV